MYPNFDMIIRVSKLACSLVVIVAPDNAIIKLKIDSLSGKFWAAAKFAQREEGEKRYLFFGKKAKFWRRKILPFCKSFGV